MRLVETLGADPREVRVGEHQPAAVLGGRPADSDRVAADAERLMEPLTELRELGLGRDDGRRRLGRDRGRGGRRAADSVDRHALARQETELVEAPVGVDHFDRRDPRLAAAARGQVLDAGPLEVEVVALHVALHRVLDGLLRAVRRLLRDQLLDRVGVDCALVEEVAVQVVRGGAVAALGVGAVRAEPARALRADRHVVLGHRADVVLGERVAVAEAHVLPVPADDVRDAVGAAPDYGARALVLLVALGGRGRRHAQKRGGARDQGERKPSSPSPHPGQT